MTEEKLPPMQPRLSKYSPTQVGSTTGKQFLPSKQFSQEQIIEALERSRGTIGKAARLLGCHINVLHKYIQTDPVIYNELATIRALPVDDAEIGLFEAVEQGEPWAIKLMLQTRGQDRGYGQTKTIKHVDWRQNLPEEVTPEGAMQLIQQFENYFVSLPEDALQNVPQKLIEGELVNKEVTKNDEQ